MSKTIEEIRKELDAPIPRSEVSERDQGGFKLSYLEGHVVINRLNKVLGQGNWDYRVVNTTKVAETQLNGKFFAAYTAEVALRVMLPGNEEMVEPIEFTDIGYGDGYDKSNPGKPHESALKEAVTDGIKRCAKSLGMSMGLALYDRTQANVVEDEEVKEQVVEASKPTKKEEPKKEVTKPKSKVGPKDELRATAMVLLAKGTVTREAWNEKLLALTGAAKIDLIETDAKAKEALDKIKTEYKKELE